MKHISFDNAELYFNDFLIGTLTDEMEFRGYINHATVENFTADSCAMMHTPDLILRFAIKNKSSRFTQILNTDKTDASIKKMLSNFGFLKIKNASGECIIINDVFWSHYPSAEFQIKRNSDNMIHSIYFLDENKI